jgi:hypothetical protein
LPRRAQQEGTNRKDAKAELRPNAKSLVNLCVLGAFAVKFILRDNVQAQGE